MSNKPPGPESKELRIVLVGKTGVGKTSVLNALLQRPGSMKPSASSQTTECSIETRCFNNQTLVVVDTPGVMNTEKTRAEVEEDLVGCITHAAPGPHVFLLVLRPEPPTAYDKAAMEIIQKIFGEESKRFTLAVFACTDEYRPDDQDVEKTFIRDFVVGHHSLDVTGRTHGDHVGDLLRKINELVGGNNGQSYTSDMLTKVQEVKVQQMEKLKCGDVMRETVTSLLSGVLGEPVAGLLRGTLDFVMSKVGEMRF